MHIIEKGTREIVREMRENESETLETAREMPRSASVMPGTVNRMRSKGSSHSLFLFLPLGSSCNHQARLLYPALPDVEKAAI